MGRNYKHTPGTLVKFQKGWQSQPKHYKSLAWMHLSQKDQTYALKSVARIFTGLAAQEYVVRHANNCAHPNDVVWSFKWVDQGGVVGVLRYKGVDVKGFYKRQ